MICFTMYEIQDVEKNNKNLMNQSILQEKAA